MQDFLGLSKTTGTLKEWPLFVSDAFSRRLLLCPQRASLHVRF